MERRNRRRMRSVTIDAENEEEFNREYDRIHKVQSRLSQRNFSLEDDENRVEEVDEREGSEHSRGNSINFNNENSDEEDEYGGLGGGGGGLGFGGGRERRRIYDEDEDEEDDGLGAGNVDENIIKETEEELCQKNRNNEEKNLDLICLYLKNSIAFQSKFNNNSNNLNICNNNNNKMITNTEDNIFNRNKNQNNLNSLSLNAIYDLNYKELVDDIINENDNTNLNENELSGGPGSLKEFICQNIESDCTLKIMFMSNNKSTKKSFVEKFFQIEKQIEDNEEEYNNINNFESPFEIRKKTVRLFNKNVSLQIFDTSDEFHKKTGISSVYYKTSQAFFIFIESTRSGSKKYLDDIYEKIEKFSCGGTIVIFGVNMLFKEDCNIDGDNLREYALDKDMMFIPMKKDDFTIKNSIIMNLLNLILIKGIDNKNIKENNLNIKNQLKQNNLSNVKSKITNKIIDSSKVKKYRYDLTKMKIPSTMGYKKKYRIAHVNAFDIEDDENDPKFHKRKLSVDI